MNTGTPDANGVGFFLRLLLIAESCGSELAGDWPCDALSETRYGHFIERGRQSAPAIDTGIVIAGSVPGFAIGSGASLGGAAVARTALRVGRSGMQAARAGSVLTPRVLVDEDGNLTPYRERVTITNNADWRTPDDGNLPDSFRAPREGERGFIGPLQRVSRGTIPTGGISIEQRRAQGGRIPEFARRDPESYYYDPQSGRYRTRPTSVTDEHAPARTTLTKGPDFEHLKTFVFKDSKGKSWDIALDGEVVDGKLIIKEAHIGPANASVGQLDEAVGQLELKNLIRSLAEQHGVKQVDIPGRLSRSGTQARRTQQGLERSKPFEFGEVTATIDESGNVTIRRLK